MNLCVVSDKNRIRDAQKHLEKRFQDETRERIRCSVRHGGTGSPGTATKEPVELPWTGELWFDSRKHHDNYYWNAFGTEKPKANRIVTPDCEINPPVEGVNRKLGGAFAEDERGSIYVPHRANKFNGIRKEDFRREYKYKEDWVTASDGDQQNQLVLIGGLEQPDLFNKIFKFVEEVKRIRSSRRAHS